MIMCFIQDQAVVIIFNSKGLYRLHPSSKLSFYADRAYFSMYRGSNVSSEGIAFTVLPIDERADISICTLNEPCQRSLHSLIVWRIGMKSQSDISMAITRRLAGQELATRIAPAVRQGNEIQ